MEIALTGGSGGLGRAIAAEAHRQGRRSRCRKMIPINNCRWQL